MASRFTVRPEVVRKDFVWVDAADGSEVKLWIKIKKELNVGEGRNVETAGWKGVRQQGADAEISIDWKGMTFARVVEYLVDWNLTDDKDNRLPLNAATLQSLHRDLYELIEKQISEHVEAIEAEKKAKRTASAPELTSA